jgi:probable HAF family extracellular repeat protein
MVDLGIGAAYAVSEDGNAVVGASHGHAFRWTQDSGMVDLHTGDQTISSSAQFVSADGSVVVGWASDTTGHLQAFRWSLSEAMQTVDQWLGIPASAVGFTASSGVSADGEVVIGGLANGHAFLARKTLHPSPAILVSPSGTITTNAPTYTWNAVSDSDWYYLWVNDTTGNKIKQWYSAAEAGCAGGSGTCAVWAETALTDGSAKWWVQTWNPYGYGLWSEPMNFTAAPAELAGKAALISPSGTIGTTMPTYSWRAVSNTNWYWLWVYDGNEYRVKQWYSAAQAGCPAGTETCSATPETALAAGSGKWWIQTYNESGFGPWSDNMAFAATVPGKAALIAPSGTTSSNLPTYTWNAVSNSTWYYLWVYDGIECRITQWFTAAQAGCPGGSGSCSATPDVIVGGTAKWWIQTWNSVGYGPWSDAMTFTAPAPTLPGKATLVSPSGEITTNLPPYTWNAVPNSTWYYLWVDDSTGTRITQWYTASQASCPGSAGICSVTPATALAAGSGKWWVQTWNVVGYGRWSDSLEFSVDMGSSE